MLFFWFFKNCELIRDSSLWRSNFIPLVHDSIIIIGSRFVTYTFGSRFTYKRWVKVLSKIWILAFLGKYSNIDCWVSKCVNWGSHHILILFVGSQCVSIEVRIIWYQSTSSKISFLSLLSFCFLLSSKKKKSEKKKRYGNYWKHCGRFNWGQIWGWVYNSQSSSLDWFVEDDYTICWFSWSRKF